MIRPYKNRTLDLSRPVRVYRNLHSQPGDGRRWSIRQGRAVVGHADSLTLQEAKFIVSAAGRQRVIREGRKNIHAFVEGYLSPEEPQLVPNYWVAQKVQYDPRWNESFVFADHTERPIHSAPYVLLRVSAFALLPRKSLHTAA